MSQRVEQRKLVYHYGDTFDGIEILWKDASGNPVVLTGYTAQMRIKAQTGLGVGEPTILQLTSALNDGLVITALAGKVAINASPAKMTSGTLQQKTRYFYDLQVKDGQETQTLLEGEFWVDPEVTTD